MNIVDDLDLNERFDRQRITAAITAIQPIIRDLNVYERLEALTTCALIVAVRSGSTREDTAQLCDVMKDKMLGNYGTFAAARELIEERDA